MKKICLILLSLLSLNCFAQQSFLNIRGDSVKIKANKKVIAVVFSPVSCHNCYKQLSDLLSLMNIDSSRVSIIAITNVSKETITNIDAKKNQYNYISTYFPAMAIENVYYNSATKGKAYLLFGKKINEHLLPNLFLINNNKVEHYIKSLYKNDDDYISNEVIEIINQFIKS